MEAGGGAWMGLFFEGGRVGRWKSGKVGKSWMWEVEVEHGWVYSLKVGKVEHGRFQVWAFGCFWKDSGFGLGLVCCPVRPVCRVRPVRPVLPRFKSRPSRSTTFQVASVPFNHVFKRRSGIISASRGRGNHPSVEAVWKTLLLLANMIHETNATNETNATDNLQPHKPKTS